VIELAGHYFAN